MMHGLGIKEIVDATIRTVEPTYIIACVKKTKQAICIGCDGRDMIFADRKLALEKLKEIKVKNIK